MLADLCDRLQRDCEADPPVVVFTTTDRDIRQRTSTVIAEMLEEVGVETQVTLHDASLFFGNQNWIDFSIPGEGVLLGAEWDLAEWSYIALPGLSGLIWWHWLFDMDPVGARKAREQFL